MFSILVAFSDLGKSQKLMSVAFSESIVVASSMHGVYGHLCGLPSNSCLGTNGFLKIFSYLVAFCDVGKNLKLKSVAFPESQAVASSMNGVYRHLCGLPGSSCLRTNGLKFFYAKPLRCFH